MAAAVRRAASACRPHAHPRTSGGTQMAHHLLVRAVASVSGAAAGEQQQSGGRRSQERLGQQHGGWSDQGSKWATLWAAVVSHPPMEGSQEGS